MEGLEYVVQVNPFEAPINGSLLVVRYTVLNKEVIKRDNWRGVITPETDLDVILPCQFGDKGESLPVSLNDFPAEKEFIRAKFAELVI